MNDTRKHVLDAITAIGRILIVMASRIRNDDEKARLAARADNALARHMKAYV